MVLIIGGVFFIACCIILISVSSRNPAITEDAERVPVVIVSPFQRMVTSGVEFIKDISRYYFFLASTARENDELRQALGRVSKR